jgi:hypothetical protein
VSYRLHCVCCIKPGVYIDDLVHALAQDIDSPTHCRTNHTNSLLQLAICGLPLCTPMWIIKETPLWLSQNMSFQRNAQAKNCSVYQRPDKTPQKSVKRFSAVLALTFRCFAVMPLDPFISQKIHFSSSPSHRTSVWNHASGVLRRTI